MPAFFEGKQASNRLFMDFPSLSISKQSCNLVAIAFDWLLEHVTVAVCSGLSTLLAD